jgi:hypothetical protein
MKKIYFGTILQMVFAIFGLALFIAGGIHFVINVIKHLSLFNSIVAMALGATLFTASRLYFMFLEAIELAAKSIETFAKIQTPPTSPQQNRTSPQSEINPEDIKIVMTNNTSPEELQPSKTNSHFWLEI